MSTLLKLSVSNIVNNVKYRKTKVNAWRKKVRKDRTASVSNL